MYKDEIFNITPILYIFIPIIFGLIIGFFCKIYTKHNIFFSIIISIILSIIYVEILGVIYSSESETQLKLILYFWNSMLTSASAMIYSIILKNYYLYKKSKKG